MIISEQSALIQIIHLTCSEKDHYINQERWIKSELSYDWDYKKGAIRDPVLIRLYCSVIDKI